MASENPSASDAFNNPAIDGVVTVNYAPTPLQTGPRWSRFHLVAFRIVGVYLLIYLLPFPLGALPLTSLLPEAIQTAIYKPMQLYQQFWQDWVPWVGKHVFDATITVFPNGSGDTTFNYVQVFVFAVLAVLIAAVWTIIDPRRPTDSGVHKWLRIYVRYGLAVVMLGYGFAKLVKIYDPSASQFPSPSGDRLLEPYGQSSPMGLLWTFMGYSTGYTVFAGAAECLGGLLLFFRRTTTLGALIVAGVMSNVVMMNMCYDVPVKLYSANLLAMAMFLILPDAKRLVEFFVLNRATPAAPIGRVFRHPALFAAALVVKGLFIGGLLYDYTNSHLAMARQYGSPAMKNPLLGIYEVESFSANGEERPPLLTDAKRWRRVNVSRFGYLVVRTMSDTQQYFRYVDDTSNGKLALTAVATSQPASLSYQRPDDDHLILEGDMLGETVSVRLKKLPDSSFPLVNRGFNWINEYPFNR